MNINNLTSFMTNMVPSTSASTEGIKDENTFKDLMDSKEDTVTKDKVSSKEKVNDKKVEAVLEDIDKAVEKIEDGSEEEIIEEIMVLLQSLNIPVVDNINNLPIIIDLKDINIIEEVTSSLEAIEEQINENTALEMNEEVINFLESDEVIIDHNIDKLLSYLSDKDGNAIKKEKFIEVISTTTAEDTSDGIDMVKMVFNRESNNNIESSEDDILAKLISLEEDEVSKTTIDDGDGYITEDTAIFTNILNEKSSNAETVINRNEPVSVSKETVSTDVVSNIKYMMKNEVQQLTVKIYPKELGEITIKLLSEDGIMKANIKSTSKETYMLLNSNMDEIKKYLSNENIAIKEVNIELYSEDTTYYSGEGFESQFQEKNQQSNHLFEDGKEIKIKEEEKEIFNEISNVNLLA